MQEKAEIREIDLAIAENYADVDYIRVIVGGQSCLIPKTIFGNSFDTVILNPNYTATGLETLATTYYDQTYKVLTTVLGNGVLLQNGLELYVRVVNKTGSTITDGKAVYISGAQGNRPKATLAIATTSAASHVIGVATEDILNNQEGFVTVFGTVNGFNTSGYTDGADMFLSASTAGNLTATEPSFPNHKVIVATALNSTNNGAIFVHPNHILELGELHGVDLTASKTTPVDTDALLLQDNAASGIWKKLTWANLKTTLSSIFEAKPTTTTVTLSVAGWSGGTTQVATVTGATATNRLRFRLPSTDAEIMEIANKQIRPTPSTQTTNELTFTCTTTPTVEVAMVCEILPAL